MSGEGRIVEAEEEANELLRDLDFDDQALEDLKSHLDPEITGHATQSVPFDPERIDVQTKTPTLSLMLDRLRRDSLDLQPDFQRLAGLWSKRNQSRLIESLLLRIPLPSFYAATDAEDNWAMVDGVQRMTSIARFISPEAIDDTPLKLVGLEYLKEFEGATFESLPGKLQTRLLESEVVLHLIREGTPDPVKFNIFARLNTGGLPLSSQEIRHALIPGQSRDVLARLSESNEFKTATDYSVNPRRMMDREMVLRFVAFSLVDPLQYVDAEFDNFLREMMRAINSLTASEVAELEENFLAAMMTAWNIFGDQAFRRRDSSTRRSAINKALFEAIAVNLASLSSQERTKLETRSEIVDQGLVRLLEDTRFASAIQQGTSSTANVRIRFERVSEMFRSILNEAK